MPPIVTQIITSYWGLSKEHSPIAAIRQHLGNTCPQSSWTVADRQKTGLKMPWSLPAFAGLQGRLGSDRAWPQRHQSEGL